MFTSIFTVDMKNDITKSASQFGNNFVEKAEFVFDRCTMEESAEEHCNHR